MTDNLKNSLFRNSDGNPVVFCMRPCAERQTLRPLINEHGGKVTSIVTPSCIKLAEKGSIVSDKDYLSTKYVRDCIKEQKFLDMDEYRIKPGTVAPGDEDDSALSDISLSPADYIEKGQAQEYKGRTKYTNEEDIAIISYLITENLYSDAQGLKVWKDMEKLKITSHTAMSMNTRYRKIILPKIHTYAIDRNWIQKLTGMIDQPGNTSFDVEDLFQTRRKSSRKQDICPPKSNNTDKAKDCSKKYLYKQLEFVKSNLDRNKTANDCVALFMSSQDPSSGGEVTSPTRKSQLSNNRNAQPSQTESDKKVCEKTCKAPKKDLAQYVCTDESLEFDELVNKSKKPVAQKKGDSVDPDVGKVSSSVGKADTSPVKSDGVKTRACLREVGISMLSDKNKDNLDTGKRKRKTKHSDATLGNLNAEKKIKTDKLLTNKKESDRIESEVNVVANDSVDEVVDTTEIHDASRQISPVKDGTFDKEINLADSTTAPNNSSKQKNSKPKRTEDSDEEAEEDSEEECRNFCEEISSQHGISYETVRCLLYACNGSAKRVCSYIMYGPHSCYPPPWTPKDDELLDCEGNKKYLIAKYRTKDVRDRLLFLEGLQFT